MTATAASSFHSALRAWGQLDAPVSAALATQLNRLKHSHLLVRGFSESRQLVSWLHAALNDCSGAPPPEPDACQLRYTLPGAIVPPPASYRNVSHCREEYYSTHPYSSHCASLDVMLSFEWKSSQYSMHDAAFHDKVERAVAASAQTGRRVIVLLSGGPHHFSKFADHKHSMHFSLPDSFAIPQRWVTNYYIDTERLLRSFTSGTLPNGGARACVLWKTSNVGPRLGDARGQRPRKAHHPSARNGIHDWLNRFTRAMAVHLGIGVLDLTDLTASVTPNPNPKAPSPHARAGEGGGGTAEVEGDYYHGFPSSLLLQPFVQRLSDACAL